MTSDSAPLNGLVAALLAAAPGTRALRAATRGGLAAVLHEIAESSGVAIEVGESRIPVREEVRAAGEILGLDPLHAANAGKLVAFVPEAESERALVALRAHPLGRDAAAIGRVAGMGADVGLSTADGATRLVERLHGEVMPREF